MSDVVTKLSDLADDRKAADICNDLFTDKLRKAFAKVGGGDCSKPVLSAIRNADYTRLAVDAIDLNGPEASATTAVARIKVTTDGPKRTITLVHSTVKAPWLIDAFGASAGVTTPKTAGTTPAASTPTKTAR